MSEEPSGLMRHPISDVHSTVRMGDDCTIWAFSTVGKLVVLGARVVVGSCCFIGHSSILGDDVHLNHGVFLPNHSWLGNRVFIGPNVTCTDDKHPRVNHRDYTAQPPVIDDDVSIGAGAVILPGVHLYQGCMIAAGAIVTRDVPMGETWAGLPAKRLQRWPEPPRGGGWLTRAREG